MSSWSAPIAAVAMLFALPTSTLAQAATGPSADGVWVRLPAVAGRPAGGFMTVKGGAKPDALVGASSPMAERIELHSMTHENGVMRMRAEKSFAVPANGQVAFVPGGNHLMLFGLKPGLKPGQTIPVTLTFQSGAKVNATAATRSAADAAPAMTVDAHKNH